MEASSSDSPSNSSTDEAGKEGQAASADNPSPAGPSTPGKAAGAANAGQDASRKPSEQQSSQSSRSALSTLPQPTAGPSITSQRQPSIVSVSTQSSYVEGDNAPSSTRRKSVANAATSPNKDVAEAPEISPKEVVLPLEPKAVEGTPSPASDAKASSVGNTDDTENELYREEDPGNMMTAFLRSFTAPGPQEQAQLEQSSKGKLGTALGVFLPTVQHVIGASVFLRLLWVVGISGLLQASLILFIICFCTFLTAISVSAVATNGEVKAGGSYYMLSRNLGPSFGAVVGVLFFLASAICCSMCLVGGCEILLVYIFPQMTIGGVKAQAETELMGMMSHNLRLYATVLLIIQFCIVSVGVKFVQCLAPCSFCCVLISIFACFAGGIEKTFFPGSSVKVCMLGDRLLASTAVIPSNGSMWDMCDYCDFSSRSSLRDELCPNCTDELRCMVAFPGFNKRVFVENIHSAFADKGEYYPGRKANQTTEVYQDMGTSFFFMLGICFPMVTGILTGANMSGDLKDPGKSIPRGTIAADMTVSIIYFSLALLYASTIEGPVLRDKYGKSLGGQFIVSHLAWPSHWVILAGAFIASIGAGLQCLCGAPRILQALAKDDVISFLKPFEKVTKRNEPFLGLLLSTAIAELAILLGAMDSIAIAVDMIFLMCYGFVNFTCAFFSIMQFPNWRPRYKYYHWSLSLLGGVLCIFLMFIISWYFAIGSCVLCGFVYQFAKWRGAKKEWGDGLRGLALSTAQYSIKKVDETEDEHPKNFRPQLLILFTRMMHVDALVDTGRSHLLQFASQLKAGKGLCVVISLVCGDPCSPLDQKVAKTMKEELSADMEDSQVRGFAKTVVYHPSQMPGCVSTLIQSVGLGGLRPNTMLLKWPMYHRDEGKRANERESEFDTFIDKLYAAVAMDMCVLVTKNITRFPGLSERLEGMIDVYWIVQDGGLCLLIAYLLTLHKVWARCTIRVIAVARENDDIKTMEDELRKHVYKLRVDAQILVVDSGADNLRSVIAQRTYAMEKRFHAVLEIESWDETTADVTTEVSEAPDGKTSKGIGTSNKKDKELKDGLTASQRKRLKKLDRRKVRKMQASVRLNQVIMEHSSSSELIFLNLPKPPSKKDELDDYLHYLEVLSANLVRLVFVRGTGVEKITGSL